MSLLTQLETGMSSRGGAAQAIARGRRYCFDPSGTVGPAPGLIVVSASPDESLVQVKAGVALPQGLDPAQVRRLCLYGCRLSVGVQLELAGGSLVAIADHPAEDAGMTLGQLACYVQSLTAACDVLATGLNELRVAGLAAAAAHMERVAASERTGGKELLLPFIGARRVDGWDGEGLERRFRTMGIHAEEIEGTGDITRVLAVLPTKRYVDLDGRNLLRTFVTCRGAEVVIEAPLPFALPAEGEQDQLVSALMDMCVQTTLFQVEADPGGDTYLVAEVFAGPDGLTDRQLRTLVASIVDPIDRLDERLNGLRPGQVRDLND